MRQRERGRYHGEGSSLDTEMSEEQQSGLDGEAETLDVRMSYRSAFILNKWAFGLLQHFNFETGLGFLA